MKKTKRSSWAIRKSKKQKSLGMHLIADFWFGKKVEDPKKLEKILIEAAIKAGSTPLKTSIHKFNPQGITGVLLLAESHISWHSWPEFNYLAIDIFTCGKKAMPQRALKYLKKVLRPKKVEVLMIERGKIK
jgi:S-adenosylmethionine decarboxylase